MAIERQTYLYEALIRFDADGFVGAHEVDMERVIDGDTGEIIAERPMAARPIQSDQIADLVGEQVLVMGRQITALQAEIEALKDESGRSDEQIGDRPA